VATAAGKQLGEATIVALASVERFGFFQRMGQLVSRWFLKQGPLQPATFA
jgi:hypothetical protein